MRACKKCLLPEKAPGAEIDSSGICFFCRTFSSEHNSAEETDRLLFEADLEQTLRWTRGEGKYDCLVCLSGGKDSVYLLYKIKREYPLRTLAFVTDMNVPEVAWNNIHRSVAKLDAELLVYTPPKEFYRKFFRYLLQNQDERGAVRTVCYVCAPLFEGYALKVAVEKKIPLVLAGYSPGQPEPERMVYEYSRAAIEETDWTPRAFHNNPLLSSAELEFFWNPSRYPKGTQFPRYLAPFHAWPYDQSAVMKKVVALGLIENATHANPIHSNCPVNWLLMYSDLKTLGYNPYAPEFSALIRKGKASKRYWQMMLPVVNWMIRAKVGLGRNVQKSLDWLGLKPEDLKVKTCP